MPGKPIVRGYDTGALFRENCLLRIQHLQMEVDADLKQMKAGGEGASNHCGTAQEDEEGDGTL